MEPPVSHDTIPKSCYKKVATFEEFTIRVGFSPDALRMLTSYYWNIEKVS